jgi:AcrR family transcriptional regulator
MTQKYNEKKRQIADVAIKLFLSQGVQGTSIRDIAEAVGTSAANLYHYFRSKDEIIDSVAELGVRSVNVTRDYYRSLGNISPTEALRKCIVQMILSPDHDRILFFNREYRSLSPARGSELMATVRQYISFFEHLLDEGIRAGEFRIENTRLVAFNIYISQQEWALRRWLLRDTLTAEEFAERQADFILKSICPPTHVLVGESGH